MRSRSTRCRRPCARPRARCARSSSSTEPRRPRAPRACTVARVPVSARVRDRGGRLPHWRRAVSHRHRRRATARGDDDPREAPLRTEQLDDVRRLLVYEPRGHADMYGCFVTEPDDDGADLGVVFFHNAGYSTACGHGTIALVDVGARRRSRRARGRDPCGRRRPVRTARDGGPDRRWARRVGPLSQRPGVRAGRSPGDAAGRRATSRSAERSTRRSTFASGRRELPRLIELGRELKREIESSREIVHPARARAARRLRCRLLAREGAARAAQRDDLRGRRGRPLPVRQRHLCTARAARRGAALSARRGAATPQHRRQRVLRRGWSATPRSRVALQWSPRSRARRTPPVATSSCSRPATARHRLPLAITSARGRGRDQPRRRRPHDHAQPAGRPERAERRDARRARTPRSRRRATRRCAPSSSPAPAVASASARTCRSSATAAGDIGDRLRATYHPNVLAIRALEKPVIAAVNGAAAGAGLSLALRVRRPHRVRAASFVPAFIDIGLVPDSGGTWLRHAAARRTRAPSSG